MNALFFSYENLAKYPGISKKILSQKKAIENHSYNVYLSHLKEIKNKKEICVNDEVIISKKDSFLGKIRWIFDKRPILKWIKDHNISLIYVRYTKFANPSFIKLFKSIKDLGITVLLEIPTYPYDKELRGHSVKEYVYKLVEKTYRKRLAKYVDRIITFSDDDEIWGRKTIKIINGVDYNFIPCITKKKNDDEINLIGVASLNFWHGYDRVIEGLKNYYKSKDHSIRVNFHIVGGKSSDEEYIKLKGLVESYSLQDYVIFYGEKIGTELDEMFNNSDIGVGSLGRHRSGIYKFQSLKNIEYGVRGIPFIYSEESDLFDNEKYIVRFSPDNTPLSIESIIKFYQNMELTPSEIRANCIKKGIDWDSQFNIVFNNLI